MTQVAKNGTTIAAFVYDGDGTRVASTINGTTTKFVGEYYEVTGTDITKYYGKTALRKNGVLTYLLADHLGSNNLITSDTGTLLSETRYKPWGEIRYATGTTSTPYTYTGQYSNTSDFGWMYYKARWYDTALGRFNQPDSIVPGAGDPRAWDRYAYVKNSPVVYNDPSGHRIACGDGEAGGCGGETAEYIYWVKYKSYHPIKKPTVLNKALSGDVNSIVDLIDPTHYGAKAKIEVALETPWGGMSPVIDLMYLHNRHTNQNAISVDIGLSPGLGIGSGGSLTVHPVVGWGASDIKRVTTGWALNGSATAAGGPALSVDISTPFPIKPDIEYGIIPFTFNVGGGAGGGYAGVGAGPSYVIFNMFW